MIKKIIYFSLFEFFLFFLCRTFIQMNSQYLTTCYIQVTTGKKAQWKKL